MELRYWMMFLGKLLASVQAITYLERGSQGYIHCPIITSKQFSLESVDAMYWYFNGRTTPFLLVSHWQGRVNVKEGLPEGVYDVDGNFSLVIHNITDSMEGNYVFKLKPKGRFVQIGEVPVKVKVTPETSRPRVIGCDINNATCDVSATKSYNLTCVVENAKPAVNITITRLSGTNQSEPVSNTETRQEPQVVSDRYKVNNTFTTYASFSVPLSDEVQKYRCEASGIAVRGANNHVTVNIRRTKSKTGTYIDLANDDATWNTASSLKFTHSVLILMATFAMLS
ncbi:uncharacterized protein [Asterias amurensis]|uniref:uncharacterized protein n=1 Tax=Asterias amurensis TaxID=7602 RepID=UPI003AB73906